MNEVGCRPPHWQTTLDLPICSESKGMKSFSRQQSTTYIESFVPPCRVINRLDYTFKEINLTEQV